LDNPRDCIHSSLKEERKNWSYFAVLFLCTLAALVQKWKQFWPLPCWNCMFGYYTHYICTSPSHRRTATKIDHTPNKKGSSSSNMCSLRDRDRGMEQWMGAANTNLGSSVMLSRRVDLTEFLVSGESCIQWPVIFFRSKTPANCLTSGDCALRT